MQVEHFRGPEGFEVLKSHWNLLLRSSYRDTVFSTWEWQRAWWEHFTPGDLWLGAGYVGSELVAIFPLYLWAKPAGERSLRLVGCVEVADYLDLIVRQGEEREAFQAFLDCLSSDSAPAWDTVELCNLPEGSPTCTLLPTMAEEAGYRARLLVEDVCPVIDLPETWEEYLASIGKKQRHEIRRKLRRAQAGAELEWYVVDGDRDLRQEVDVFLDLHRKSTSEKDAFMDEQMEAFFHTVARCMQDAGWLQLMQLKMDSRPVASLISFDYGDSLMVYNSGYDPDSHAHLSPGIVLLSICIQNAINSGKRAFDFLRGDEEYKYRFGAHDTTVYRLILERED